jgi:hypothetical protein
MYNKKEMEDDKKDSIIWRAAEYEYHPKTSGWYYIVIAITLIIAILALVQKNFFFFLFVTIAGLMIITLGRRKPKIIDFYVGKDEIRIEGDTVYNYKNIKWYSILENKESLNEIVLKTDSHINPIVKLRADSQTTEKVKPILSEKLEEEEYEPSMSDLISEILHF